MMMVVVVEDFEARMYAGCSLRCLEENVGWMVDGGCRTYALCVIKDRRCRRCNFCWKEEALEDGDAVAYGYRWLFEMLIIHDNGILLRALLNSSDDGCACADVLEVNPGSGKSEVLSQCRRKTRARVRRVSWLS